MTQLPLVGEGAKAFGRDGVPSRTWWAPLTMLPVVVAAALGIAIGGCADEDCSDADSGGCGIRKNQITVLFRESTTPETVAAINGEIGASVLYAPDIGTLYRIKLPKGWCYQRGKAFYEKRPEVKAVSLSIDICPD